MFGALKNISRTLLAILQTRLSLLGNELQAQKVLLLQLSGLLLAMLFCAGLAVLSGLGMVVSIWWEQRVLVLGVSATVLTAFALGCYFRLQSLLNPAEALFGASLAALQDDMTQLRAMAQTGKDTSGQKQRGETSEQAVTGTSS